MRTIDIHVCVTGIGGDYKEVCKFDITKQEAEQLYKSRDQQHQTPIIQNLFRRLADELHPRIKHAPCVGKFPHKCISQAYGSVSILWIAQTGEVFNVEVPFCKECKSKVVRRSATYTNEYKDALFSPLHLC